MKIIFVFFIFIILIIFTIYFLPNTGQFQKQIHSPSPLPQQKENSSKSPSHPLEPTGDISRLPSPLPKLTGDINKFPLTYMQASKYKGPIVEGWPPERNRLLDLYIRPKEDTFYMTPTSKAIKNCKFLIMIHTLPDFFESRTGIRNTYGRYLSEKLAGNTSLLFIIGNLKKANNDNYESTWNKLQKEQEIFGDILQVYTPMFVQIFCDIFFIIIHTYRQIWENTIIISHSKLYLPSSISSILQISLLHLQSTL